MNSKDTKFEKVYSEYKNRIFWYIRKKINIEQDALDITSDIFLKLYERPEILERDSGGILAWLYTVGRNACTDYYRRKENNVVKISSSEDIFDFVPAEEIDLGEVLDSEKKLSIIDEELKSLTDSEREMFYFRFRDELKFKEIALILNKNEGMIKMAIKRILDKIRKRLKDGGTVI